MRVLLVGDKSRFAIESYVDRYLQSPGQLASGYFLVYVDGKSYGVQSRDATLLACSFDQVSRRLSRRGTHVAAFGMRASLEELVYVAHSSMYGDDDDPDAKFWGMSADDLRGLLITRELAFAPDGDAAFDDGGNILQFDQGDHVRIVAFKNSALAPSGTDSLAEVRMDATAFYRILEDWCDQFHHAWLQALNDPTFMEGTVLH